MSDNIAFNDVLALQMVLGQLGFTLKSGNEYYKDYASADGVYFRLMPLIDYGISVDTRCKIRGFNISSYKTVSVIDGVIFDANSIQSDSLPIECLNDMTSIVGSLAPLSKQPAAETFINTTECSMCNKITESYVMIKGAYVCPRCLGMQSE